MKAFLHRFHGQPLQAVEIKTPEARGSEVIVEVSHCGVCHSDLHAWQGKVDYGRRGVVVRPEPAQPIAMGHEIAGRIVALGPQARDARIGDAVIAYPWLGCGACSDCTGGRDNMCRNGPRSLGFAQHGGFAEQVVLPHPRYVFPLGDLDPALAATYACSGLTVRSAIRKIMPLAPDEPLLVIGAGGLGLQAVAMLRALDHERIIIADMSAEKRGAALAAGALDFLHLRGDGDIEHLADLAGGPIPAVLDFVNNGQTALLAFDALRKGGRMVQVGLFGGELAIPLYSLALKGISICGSITGTLEDLADVLRLAREGRLRPLPIETLPKSRVNLALARLAGGAVQGRLVLAEDALDDAAVDDDGLAGDHPRAG
ncbi:alcohol dehydrogenase [Rhizobium sp. SSA_523]|uniref:alcohol dehydrogenase n=1 Tax=Rhizobium sp. SSA_523 TaxID=2952477 RepID=UPI002091B9BD|nr:alcohol dehydrogenase [Rhizobium sp. SSA_523]MCO5732191.1 alcohol dehydrogenase [Rhizobium sp. SSA_523]WKC21394.1 alcohol dehydrogenase [Rhizobium sp. SSA_523]